LGLIGTFSWLVGWLVLAGWLAGWYWLVNRLTLWLSGVWLGW